MNYDVESLQLDRLEFCEKTYKLASAWARTQDMKGGMIKIPNSISITMPKFEIERQGRPVVCVVFELTDLRNIKFTPYGNLAFDNMLEWCEENVVVKEYPVLNQNFLQETGFLGLIQLGISKWHPLAFAFHFGHQDDVLREKTKGKLFWLDPVFNFQGHYLRERVRGDGYTEVSVLFQVALSTCVELTHRLKDGNPK